MGVEKIQALPDFQTELLGGFQFGDPDGKLDEVLEHSATMVRGVREFLAGNKAIVLGERGAGKSALFKLLSEGKFNFYEPPDKQLRPLVIAIDSEVHYLSIANVVAERFVDQAKKPNGKYVFLWEIFILATVVQQLTETYPDDAEAQTLGQDFGEVLGIKSDRKQGIADYFARFKYTVGAKIDPSGNVAPTFSVEPTKVEAEKPCSVTDHEIAQFRERVRKFIKVKRRIVYVLVDRVDDFVTDQEYEEQKKRACQKFCV